MLTTKTDGTGSQIDIRSRRDMRTWTIGEGKGDNRNIQFTEKWPLKRCVYYCKIHYNTEEISGTNRLSDWLQLELGGHWGCHASYECHCSVGIEQVPSVPLLQLKQWHQYASSLSSSTIIIRHSGEANHHQFRPWNSLTIWSILTVIMLTLTVMNKAIYRNDFWLFKYKQHKHMMTVLRTTSPEALFLDENTPKHVWWPGSAWTRWGSFPQTP